MRPGRPFRAAVRLSMEPGWHTYWKNPGGAGAPTRILWEVPRGGSVGEVQWPAPERIPSGRLVSFGYETEVVFVAEIRPPEEITGETFALRASVQWVACEEVCVAGDADLHLDLPVAPDEPAPSRAAEAIDAAIRAVPIPGPAAQASVLEDPMRTTFVWIPLPDSLPRRYTIFPEDPRLTPVEVRQIKGNLVLDIFLGSLRPPPDRFRAVVVPRGGRAFTVDAALSPPPPPSAWPYAVAAVLAGATVVYLLRRRRSS